MACEPTATGSVALVAVPLPAQGHLNQMLQLSLVVASRGLSVHYAAPAAHLRQARSRVHGWDDKAFASINFHDLDVSMYDSPPPDPTAPSPFPNHLLPLWEAFTATAGAHLAVLLRRLSATHRRVVVVYDRINSFAAVEAARLGNAEAYGLQCVATSYLLGRLDAAHHLIRDNGLGYVPVQTSMSKEALAHMLRTMAAVSVSPTPAAAPAGLVMNTSRALEGEFIDAVADLPEFKDQKLFAVGPLNPVLADETRTPAHGCMDWLDAQPPASVLYLSFGTTTSLRGEQIAEMAAALKASRQSFIWVLRDADRADIFADRHHTGGEMSSGLDMAEFTKGTSGRGVVITGWAPQSEILAHSATAAFMSHCGWNSTLESLSHGKPILAWPMHSDQPWDAELLCKYLKVGLLVRPWEKHGEVIPSDAIREVIEEAMVSQGGIEMRQRAKVLGEAVRASISEGGSSTQDMDRFIAHITR